MSEVFNGVVSCVSVSTFMLSIVFVHIVHSLAYFGGMLDGFFFFFVLALINRSTSPENIT